MVTDRDITIRVTSEGRDANSTPVTEAMTPEIAFVFEDDDVRQAAKVMKEKQIRRLPVLDRGKNLVGIVSLGDLSAVGDDKMAGDTLEQISEPASSAQGQRPA
jgi:CBS domain-containing protein